MVLLWRWLFNALALLLVAYILPGVEVESFYIALITAAVLGIVNLLLKPILIFLTLPITVLTLGLFTLVINGLLFWFVASFVEGFSVDGLGTAIVAAFILSIFSFFSQHLIKNK